MVRIAALCVFPMYFSPGLENQPLKRPAPAIRHFRPSPDSLSTRASDKVDPQNPHCTPIVISRLKEVAPRSNKVIIALFPFEESCKYIWLAFSLNGIYLSISLKAPLWNSLNKNSCTGMRKKHYLIYDTNYIWLSIYMKNYLQRR